MKRTLPLFFALVVFIHAFPAFAQQNPLRTLTLGDGEGDEVYSVDVSLDESLLLTGGRKPILWNPDTGEKVRVFQGHDEFDVFPDFPIRIYSISVSKNNHLLASGDIRKNIIVSNIKTGEAVMKTRSKNLEPGGPGIVGVEIMPDHQRVLSANSNGTLEMWDITSGELLQSYYRGGISKMILLNDGKRVILQEGTTIVLFNLEQGQSETAFSGFYPSLSNDEKIMQYYGRHQTLDSGAVIHVNIETSERIREFVPQIDDSIQTIDISPDAKNYLIGNGVRENGVTSLTNRALLDAVVPGQIRSYEVRADVSKESPLSEDKIIKYFPRGRKFLTVNGKSVHIWDIGDVVSKVKDDQLHETGNPNQ